MPETTDGRLWWQDAVIYQIYPRSFQDSNGDGIGDLPGIIQRLPYLHQTLGIDAIWLSPFYPSPMADFGYDVADYTDVDPMFGTLDDFDRLTTEMHRRGMKVLIDFVPNHSSDQHPWFIESRSSRDNPRRDWYVWADARPDGSPPNNWLSVFGGSAWEWDEHTGQYYLHSFLKEQPDLNWRNLEVKETMLNVLRFWLDRGVDGFRIDVAHFIMKDPELRDNPSASTDDGNYKSMGEYDSQVHVYDHGHPDVHAVFREIRQVLDSYSATSPRTSVAEIHVFDWQEWAGYYGAQLDEIHMPFNFGLLRAPWEAAAVKQVVDAIEAALPTGAWPNYVLSNHDEHRIVSRLGIPQARAAMMLLLTLRGTPTMYYGDEIGMHNVEITPEQEQDPWGKRVPGLSRDPERTPMQWDHSPNAGFCPPDVSPWLPVAGDFEHVNVQGEVNDQQSMLSLTRGLLQLQGSSPALHAGSYRPVSDSPPETFAYIRQSDDEAYLVAINFSDKPQRVPLSGMTGRIVLATGLDRSENVQGDSLDLTGYEGCVVRLH